MGRPQAVADLVPSLPVFLFPIVRVFCQRRIVSFLISGSVHFGEAAGDHCYQPQRVNKTKAKEEREKME